MKGIVEMSAKFSGKCAECYGTIQEGDEIYYNKAMRKASHKHCPAPVVKDYMAEASKWGAIMGEDMARRQSGRLYFLMGFVRRFTEAEFIDNATNSAHNQANECRVPAAQKHAFITLFVEQYIAAYKAAVAEWEAKQQQCEPHFEEAMPTVESPAPVKLSARKQRIAKRLEVLGVVFDGQKANGRYVISGVACRNLDEVEEYVKTLEDANAQQSVAENWENALKPNNKCTKMSEQTISLKCYKDNEPVYVEVKGFKKGGLAVHRHLSKHGHYTITHLETSIAFSSFKMNKKQAIEWLEESAKLLDWTKMDPFAVGNGKYCVEVPRIAMRITGSPVY